MTDPERAVPVGFKQVRTDLRLSPWARPTVSLSPVLWRISDPVAKKQLEEKSPSRCSLRLGPLDFEQRVGLGPLRGRHLKDVGIFTFSV